MKLIINIPAFNEESKIAETIKKIPLNFDNIDEVFIQVIDDGSKDKTAEAAKSAGAHFVFSHNTNLGIGKTFRTGVEKALENGADAMVNLDADGQFNPQDIYKILQPVMKGEADMVSASRFGGRVAQNIPWIKSFLNQVAARIIGKFMNAKIDDLTCGFRAYSRETLLRLNLLGDFTYTQEVIIDALGKNMKVKWVPIDVVYFPERKSRVVKNTYTYVNNSLRIIIKAVRDVRPMKFFGIPGFFLMIVSLATLAVFLFFYFQEFKISPYRNYLILSISMFLIGLQFLVFALIADMIKTTRKIIEDQSYLVKKEKYKK